MNKCKCRKINGIHKYKLKQHPNAPHKGYFSENCYLTSYISSFGTKILIGFEKFSIKTTHLVPRYLLIFFGGN